MYVLCIYQKLIQDPRKPYTYENVERKKEQVHNFTVTGQI